MRLLLDAQLSGRVIGRRLREQGHDVVALTERRELERIQDPDVLALAARDSRVLITHNVQDFPDILREWAESGRDHAGCLIVVGVNLNQLGLIIRCIEAELLEFPRQDDWLNRTVQVGRSAIT